MKVNYRIFVKNTMFTDFVCNDDIVGNGSADGV